MNDPMYEEEVCECPGCGTKMETDGFKGDYRIFTCPQECEIIIEQPVPNASSEGVTMEDLQSIADFSSNSE